MIVLTLTREETAALYMLLKDNADSISDTKGIGIPGLDNVWVNVKAIVEGNR